MRFIWQVTDWPTFTWRDELVAPGLADAYRAQGEVLGALRHLVADRRIALEVDARTSDAIETSRIEGEILDPASARSSIARRLHAATPAGPPSRGADTEGIAAVTIDATRRARSPLTMTRLGRWNALLLRGRTIRSGTFRSGPMQVVSGPYGRERVHFEAPPGAAVRGEVGRFLDALAARRLADDPIVAAAIAHLWFVTIHPYEDGNGRISRAIADLVLARGFPDVTRYVSMTRQISREREDYYDALESAQHGSLDITAWIVWFVGCYARAARATRAIIDDVAGAGRVWTAAAAHGISERQALVLRRVLDGFEGHITAKKYAIIAKVSEDTAQRDLADLAAKAVLARVGAGKKTAYAVADIATDGA